MDHTNESVVASEKIELALAAIDLAGDAGVAHLAQCVDDLLANPSARYVWVDLANVPYVSSRVINELLRLRKCLHDRRGNLRLINPTPNVRGVLRRCQLEQLFSLNQSVQLCKTTLRASPTSAEVGTLIQPRAEEHHMTIEMAESATGPANERQAILAGKTSHEQIATAAYQVWERRGRPAGQELAHWLTAENELGDTRKWGRLPARI